MAETQLGMFVKYPQPGEVKTRLAASIGEESASRVYRAFVQALAVRFAGCADLCVLAYSPAERREEFGMLLGAGTGWELQPQSPGDLGERMHSYFAAAMASDVRRVVLIGSDSPTLPTEFIHQAFAHLQRHPVVLGPSEDGGYYLLGLRDEVPPIFEDIPWSSDAVWRETTAHLASAGIDYATLPPWYDVDDVNDLQRLRAEIDPSPVNVSEFCVLKRVLDECREC